MKYNVIEKNIIKTVIKYAHSADIDVNRPLTLEPYSLDVRSIATLFIDIEKLFGVDLNCVFQHKMDFSIASITSAVERCINIE